MRLTLSKRLKLCFEILTVRSGHGHFAQEKQLSTFQRGYSSGIKDAKLEHNEIRAACAKRAEEVVWSLPTKEAGKTSRELFLTHNDKAKRRTLFMRPI